jgi:hypothetical protein
MLRLFQLAGLTSAVPLSKIESGEQAVSISVLYFRRVFGHTTISTGPLILERRLSPKVDKIHGNPCSHHRTAADNFSGF